MKIQFSRLLEIQNMSKTPTDEEKEVLWTYHTVYAITNDRLMIAYIGETDDTWTRIFDFWKVDKRHVDGENAPIYEDFEGDYNNTYFEILEKDCDNEVREFYWDDWYRNNTEYTVVSFPGRPGISNFNKGRIGITKDKKNRYVFEDQLEYYLSNGWRKGTFRDKATPEAKRNMSLSHKGKSPGNKGKKASEETKRSLRKAHELDFAIYKYKDKYILLKPANLHKSSNKYNNELEYLVHLKNADQFILDKVYEDYYNELNSAEDKFIELYHEKLFIIYDIDNDYYYRRLGNKRARNKNTKYIGKYDEVSDEIKSRTKYQLLWYVSNITINKNIDKLCNLNKKDF